MNVMAHVPFLQHSQNYIVHISNIDLYSIIGKGIYQVWIQSLVGA